MGVQRIWSTSLGQKCTAAIAVGWGWEAAQASSCRFEGVHTPKSILDCSFLGSSVSFSQMNWALDSMVYSFPSPFLEKFIDSLEREKEENINLFLLFMDSLIHVL